MLRTGPGVFGVKTRAGMSMTSRFISAIAMGPS